MMKIICVMPFFFFAAVNSATAFSGGSGTAIDPYRISVPNDIYLLSSTPSAWSSNFILTNDLELTNFSFQPIATMAAKFNGVFDGNAHTINGLLISGSTYANAGFFGAVGTNGVVKNLTLTNVIASLTYTSWLYAGIVAGYNSGSITNCNVNGKISASSTTITYAGVITGYNDTSGYISDCSVSASLSTSYYGGGISGYNAGTVADSSSAGVIIADKTASVAAILVYSGGIVGFSGDLSTIANCSSTAVVSASINATSKSASAWAGGITAYAVTNAAISQCFTSGNVSAIVDTGNPASAYSGGIVGGSKGDVSECFSSGPVSARAVASNATSTSTSYAGGIFGTNDGNAENCYSTSPVNSYATGSPNGAYAGGILGFQSTSNISNCYSTGTVTSNTPSYSGAFAGKLTSGSITASFWDKETSGIPSQAIGSFSGGTYTITGKTTAQMKTASTFTSAGWNFSLIWKMSEISSQFEGYPALLWQDDSTFDTLAITLVQGWNWVSFNVLPEEPTLQNVLSGFQATNNDVIVAGDGKNATYFNGAWYGTLTNIKPGAKYRLKSAGGGTFTVYGDFVNQATEIPLTNGWNWLGYCLQNAMPFSEALSLLQAANNDVVISSDGKNSTYYNGTWYGTISSLEPGKGYMLKVASAQTFCYAVSADALNGEPALSVNMADFAALASQWLFDDCNEPDWCRGADTDLSGTVDGNDLIFVIESWLE